MTELVLIIIMLIASMVIAPIYLIMRSRVQKVAVDADEPKSFYTVYRVVWVTLGHMTLSAVSLSFIFALFVFVKQRESLEIWSREQILSAALLGISFLMIMYGGGMYIAAITGEQYTLNKLKKMKEFNVLHLSTELFHGPISHVLAFVGLLVSFFSISLLELTLAARQVADYGLYVFTGAVAGWLFAMVLIKNHTWRHQIPGVVGVAIAFGLKLLVYEVELINYPFVSFFAAFIAVATLMMFGKWLQFTLRKEHYLYENLFEK